MNWDRIQGNWKQVPRQGAAAMGEAWRPRPGRRPKGRAVGKIQERHSIARNAAKKQVEVGCATSDHASVRCGPPCGGGGLADRAANHL